MLRSKRYGSGDIHLPAVLARPFALKRVFPLNFGSTSSDIARFCPKLVR